MCDDRRQKKCGLISTLSLHCFELPASQWLSFANSDRKGSFSELPPLGKLQSWVKYDGKFASFGQEFQWTKFNAVERVDMNNARRFLSRGSTLLRGCWFGSKKLHFQKNFGRNFIAVEEVRKTRDFERRGDRLRALNENITYTRGSRRVTVNELWGWVDADWAGDIELVGLAQASFWW